MREFNVAIDQNGNVPIPLEMRKIMRLAHGERLIMRLEADRIVMRKSSDLMSKLQTRFQKIPHSLADELIQERRQEAKKALL